MPRIPESELERLKTDVSLVRLVEASGVVLKKQGKDWAACCPFHEEDTPSFVVTADKNLFHCFGCGAAGGPIDWIMKREGVSFRHAVELLRDSSSLAADVPAKPVKRTTVRKLDAPLATDTSDAEALARVVAFYHATLQDSAEGLAYLKQRGLDHPELIETFRLGLANRTLAYRLPEKNRAAGAAMRAQLQRIGILRESGHEHFNGSLVVPIFDAAGNVVEMYGRKIHDNLRAGTAKHLYLPGPHQGIWNRAALGSVELILCESIIDAMTFWCAGYRNVICAYGTHGFTDELLEAIVASGTQRVLIAFDRDAAGEQGTREVADKLTARGIEAWQVQFPKGMDANEYALRVQPATKSLGVALRNAQWLGNGAPPPRVTLPAVETREDVSDSSSLAAQETPSVASESSDVHTPVPELAEASPLPEQATHAAPAYVVAGDELRIVLDARFYRVRGLPAKASSEQLKVNLLVKPASEAGSAHPLSGTHVDTVDLYSARQRVAYAKQASVELGCAEEAIKRDLGALILALEAWQEERAAQVQAATAPKALTELERSAALDLLRDPKLMERLLADFARAGMVGEESNKLLGYLACVSRKLAKPLAILIQSSSAAGKSALMDAVLAMMPADELVRYSAMTGQSLYYLGQTNLKHRILAIAEEEGAAQASYALKLLQSDGEITIASTGKDAVSGQLVTQEYRVEGPVMLFLTTTAIDIDEELLNRCLVLTVNESRAQTQAIHAAQRERRTLAGLQASLAHTAVCETHQHAQRLLRPLAVVNPYAHQLTFHDHTPRTRRDHEKFLTLIDAIALLHQHQRAVKRLLHGGRDVEYIEVTEGDIALAQRLWPSRTGEDDLAPQTHRLWCAVSGYVRAQAMAQGVRAGEVRFTRKALRSACGIGATQLGVHLQRLIELEYVLAHRGGRGQSFVYELLELAEPTSTTDSSRGEGAELSGAKRPENGPVPATSRAKKTPKSSGKAGVPAQITVLADQHVLPAHTSAPHRSRSRAGASSLAAR